MILNLTVILKEISLIRDYLLKHITKVSYHIHGHNSHKSSMINGTKEKSVFNYEFIEL